MEICRVSVNSGSRVDGSYDPLRNVGVAAEPKRDSILTDEKPMTDRMESHDAVWERVGVCSAGCFDARGTRVVVTGAAAGLGFAMAEVLAECGARVTSADIHAERLEDATARIDGGSLIQV